MPKAILELPEMPESCETCPIKRYLHAPIREGKIIYQHPEGRFIVLEFEGRSEKFREAFWPENVEKVGI